MADARVPPSGAITGLVLAGGQGSRMGGVDKGLQPFAGQPLARHALARLRPQVGALAINANRHLDTYAAWGLPVWPDAQGSGDGDSADGATEPYAGPLAGFLAGLDHCATPWLLTVPCDSPFFPTNLAARLAAAAQRDDASIALAAGPGGEPQPVFCLLRASLRDDLAAYLRQGGRKIRGWTDRHRCTSARFDQPGDDPRAFANANTLAELQTLGYP